MTPSASNCPAGRSSTRISIRIRLISTPLCTTTSLRAWKTRWPTRVSSSARRSSLKSPAAQRSSAFPSSPSWTCVRNPRRPALTPRTGMRAAAACCAVHSKVPSPPTLTINRVPLRSPASAPGRSSAVAQYVQTRNPRASSCRRAPITGGPPMSIRGWQTIPTASAMAIQIKQKLTVPFGPHDRRGDLAGNGVADLGRELAQASDDRAMLLRVAHDAPLPHRAFADLELRLDQGDDLAGWAEQLPNTRQHQPQGDEGNVDDRQVGRQRQLLQVSDVDPLHDGDARILAQAPGQLAIADVNRDHPRRPALEEDIGKAASRRPYIQGGPAAGIDRVGIECRRQLLSAPADVGRGSCHLDRLLGRHHLVGPAHGDARDPDETGSNHRLGALPRCDQAALHQGLVEAPTLRHHHRQSPSPITIPNTAPAMTSIGVWPRSSRSRSW